MNEIGYTWGRAFKHRRACDNYNIITAFHVPYDLRVAFFLKKVFRHEDVSK